MPLLKPPAPTVAKSKYYIRIGEPLALTLPRERNRNCEEPVKGQARWRGSLRSPLTEPSQFQTNPPLWKRKKMTGLTTTPQSFEVSMSAPEYGAVFHPHEQWGIRSNQRPCSDGASSSTHDM